MLLVLLCPGQGGLGSVSRSALGGRLGRGLLGFVVELVGRVGGDLRRGLRLLGRLLGRIVSLLQRERGGLGVGQRLVRDGLGVGRVGQGLDGSGHVGLGLLQLFCARLARQILRIRGLLSLRVGRFAGVGVCRVGLLHGGLEGDDRSFRRLGCLLGRIVGGLRLGLRAGSAAVLASAAVGAALAGLGASGVSRRPDGNREGNHKVAKWS